MQEPNKDKLYQDNQNGEPLFYYTIFEQNFKLKIMASFNLQKNSESHVTAELSKEQIKYIDITGGIKALPGGIEKNTNIITTKHLLDNLMYPSSTGEGIHWLSTNANLFLQELDITNNIPMQKEVLDFFTRVLLLGIKYERDREKRNDTSPLINQSPYREEERENQIAIYLQKYKEKELYTMYPNVFKHFSTEKIPLREDKREGRVQEDDLLYEIFTYGAGTWKAYNLEQRTALYMPN